MHCATDYSRIFDRYDANQDRHRIAIDAEIRARLSRPGRAGAVRILDLACGTGNWLAVQMRAYAAEPIVWHGLDASADMLGLARAKVPAARLVEGRAEHLPYADGEFDFVAVNFAFHHFGEKDAVLDEIVRVLAPGGAVRMNNFAAERADHWWVYHYFPAAVAIDRERCWPVERIVAALAARGVPSEFALTLDDHPVPFAAMLEDARRRDISELNLIPEPDYEGGLDAIARDAAAAPAAAVPCGLPLYSLLGRK
jgi:ubiquinone/menaquinone biosynthesis C-methylase UbiE